MRLPWNPRLSRVALSPSLAGDDQSNIGRLLVRKGYVTDDQIRDAMARQLVAAPPLGEILIEMGAITREQLDEVLFEQRRARGETTDQEEVRHTLVQQHRSMRDITNGLTEAAGLANALATKIRSK